MSFKEDNGARKSFPSESGEDRRLIEMFHQIFEQTHFRPLEGQSPWKMHINILKIDHPFIILFSFYLQRHVHLYKENVL